MCDKQEEWYDALIKLKDPEMRRKIGLSGKSSVEGYTLERIATEWCILLDHLISGSITAINIKSKVNKNH